MGCDIHCFVEKKVDEKYNCWQQVKLYKVEEYHQDIKVVDPYDGRNYDLFSILAGVRGPYEPLVYPRGLPENLSEDVEKERAWMGQDAHTQTWYDLNELFLLREVHKSEEEYESFVDFVNWIEFYLHFAGEWVFSDVTPGKYRVVIWFDS